MDDLTNDDRAYFARRAIEGYRRARKCEDDVATDARDLICDLVHLLVAEEGNNPLVAIEGVRGALFNFYCEHYDTEPAANHVIDIVVEGMKV